LLTIQNFRITERGKGQIIRYREGNKKEGPPEPATHFFDNPKTNLTYEKNLYIFYFKNRAKLFAKIKTKYLLKKLLTVKFNI